MRIARHTLILSTIVLLGPGVGSAFGQDVAAPPPVVPHDLEGRDDCLMCHSGAMDGMPAVPENHAGRGNATCLSCHGPDAAMQTLTPPSIPHELEGRSECSMCHTSGMEGIPQAPADHEGRPNDACAMCHQAAGD